MVVMTMIWEKRKKWSFVKVFSCVIVRRREQNSKPPWDRLDFCHENWLNNFIVLYLLYDDGVWILVNHWIIQWHNKKYLKFLHTLVGEISPLPIKSINYIASLHFSNDVKYVKKRNMVENEPWPFCQPPELRLLTHAAAAAAMVTITLCCSF